MPPGSLDGLLVADFSRVLAGPLATMTLADLGADVVKVERPGTGDDTRTWGPPWSARGDATYYLGLNRGKRSIALDLADPGDRELAARLCARADVVVQSFRPGRMGRFGLGYEDVAAVNPGVVYASVTAFGAAHDLPGYDLLLQALSGLMSVTGEPGGRPLKVGAALIDLVTGLQLTAGILAALRARDGGPTGTGQHVEVSLMRSALGALLNQASGYLEAGVVPAPMGNRHPSVAPYETFRTADGDIAVTVGNDALFARLCGVLGRGELAADPRFSTNAARLKHRDALTAELEAALAGATTAGWVERLGAAGVPAGPINDVAAAFALADELGLAAVDETGGVRTVASPIGLSGTPAGVRRPPPRLDEHGDELRAWLTEDR